IPSVSGSSSSPLSPKGSPERSSFFSGMIKRVTQVFEYFISEPEKKTVSRPMTITRVPSSSTLVSESVGPAEVKNEAPVKPNLEAAVLEGSNVVKSIGDTEINAVLNCINNIINEIKKTEENYQTQLGAFKTKCNALLTESSSDDEQSVHRLFSAQPEPIAAAESGGTGTWLSDDEKSIVKGFAESYSVFFDVSKEISEILNTVGQVHATSDLKEALEKLRTLPEPLKNKISNDTFKQYLSSLSAFQSVLKSVTTKIKSLEDFKVIVAGKEQRCLGGYLAPFTRMTRYPMLFKELNKNIIKHVKELKESSGLDLTKPVNVEGLEIADIKIAGPDENGLLLKDAIQLLQSFEKIATEMNSLNPPEKGKNGLENTTKNVSNVGHSTFKNWFKNMRFPFWKGNKVRPAILPYGFVEPSSLSSSRRTSFSQDSNSSSKPSDKSSEESEI
ncbi:MAG: hypothetical protein WCG42_10470, partial [Parachlamydiaceae bacterium]